MPTTKTTKTTAPKVATSKSAEPSEQLEPTELTPITVEALGETWELNPKALRSLEFISVARVLNSATEDPVEQVGALQSALTLTLGVEQHDRFVELLRDADGLTDVQAYGEAAHAILGAIDPN